MLIFSDILTKNDFFKMIPIKMSSFTKCLYFWTCAQRNSSRYIDKKRFLQNDSKNMSSFTKCLYYWTCEQKKTLHEKIFFRFFIFSDINILFPEMLIFMEIWTKIIFFKRSQNMSFYRYVDIYNIL